MNNWAILLAVAPLCCVAGSYEARAEDSPRPCPVLEQQAECLNKDVQFLQWQQSRLIEARTSVDEAGNKAMQPAIDRKLGFIDQTQSLLRAWFMADAALINANEKLSAFQSRITRLQEMQSDISDADAYTALFEAENKAKEELRDIAATALVKRGKAWESYLLYRKIAVALTIPSSSDRQVQRADREQITPSCSIDSTNQRNNLNAHECISKALGKRGFATAPLSASAVNIVGRPLDQRGLFTSITGSKDGTTLSLGWANEHRFRTPYTGGGQRTFTLGYALNLKSDGGDLFSFSPAKNGDTIGALDRLSTKSSIGGTLSLNWYPFEGPAARAVRGERMAAKLRKACLDEQQGKAEAIPSTCQDQDLINWIFAADDKLGFAHANEVQEFNNFYFGSPEKNARFGIGINVEYARPGFSYIDAKRSTPDQIGTLLASGIKPERHDAWAYGGFAYLHVPEKSQIFDLTLVGSLTRKHIWEEADKALFCPAIDTSQAFHTAGCQTLGISGPERIQTWIPGGELRMIFGGMAWRRLSIPQFAIAPKWTWDTQQKRKGFEMPVYFAVGDDKSLTAGIKYSREKGGKDASGMPLDKEEMVSIVVGKTFTINPK